MTWKLKGSLLAASVATAVAASQAQASFQYDLRFAPGQVGVVDTHNVALTAASPSTYTLQLWGQITGDTNAANDGWTSGFVSADSVQGATPAFTSGGITAVTAGTHAANGNAVGVAANITADGISDWGSAATTASTGYTFWRGGNAPGYIGGTADAGQSEQVNANTWEVLLATYTVTVGGISSSAGTTAINLLAPATIKNGALAGPAITYYQDDPNILNADAANKGTTFTSIGNVTFSTTGGVTTPEPASLGLLALGGLALMNRRRKA